MIHSGYSRGLKVAVGAGLTVSGCLYVVSPLLGLEPNFISVILTFSR